MPLPIDGALAELHAALDHQRLVIVQAPPGTGKTTRVPPSLTAQPWVGARKVLILEPRRVAARAAAARMAEERGEQVGDTIGLRTRTTHGCPQSPVSRSSPRACSPACCSTIRHSRATRLCSSTSSTNGRFTPTPPWPSSARPWAPCARSADRGHVGHAHAEALAARLRTDAVVKVEAERHPVTSAIARPSRARISPTQRHRRCRRSRLEMPTPVICSSSSRGSVPLLVSNGPCVGPLAVVSMTSSS